MKCYTTQSLPRTCRSGRGRAPRRSSRRLVAAMLHRSSIPDQEDRERTEGERERGQEEKTIARLTGEKTVRHDRVAVAAFLSSRRSSVNVVIVVVQHVSLVIVAVVVFVVVRLGLWPILCLGPGTSSLLIHQLPRRSQVR